MDDQSVQFGRDFDLAAEPTPQRPTRAYFFEHFVLKLVDRREAPDPSLIDKAMAGRAGALPAANGIDPGNSRLKRAAHDADPGFNLYAMFAAIALNVGNACHGWYLGIPCHLACPGDGGS